MPYSAIVCNILLLLWIPQKWQLGFWPFCILLFIICPNCPCTQLFLVPYSCFVFCCAGAACPGASTAAKGPRSELVSKCRGIPMVRGHPSSSWAENTWLSQTGHPSGQWQGLRSREESSGRTGAHDRLLVDAAGSSGAGTAQPSSFSAVLVSASRSGAAGLSCFSHPRSSQHGIGWALRHFSVFQPRWAPEARPRVLPSSLGSSRQSSAFPPSPRLPPPLPAASRLSLLIRLPPPGFGCLRSHSSWLGSSCSSPPRARLRWALPARPGSCVCGQRLFKFTSLLLWYRNATFPTSWLLH